MDWVRVAETALAHYAVGDARLVFLGHSENVTFRVEAQGGRHPGPGELDAHGRFLLRIHHPATRFRTDIWQRRDVINSELLWLAALRRDTELVVPNPVRNQTNNFVTEVVIDGAYEPLNCTLLHWVDGRLLGDKRTPVQASRVGALMARLHQHASQWKLPQGFVRPKYDSEALQASLMNLRPAVRNGIISTADFEVFNTAVQRIHRMVTALGETQHTWGLIHADLHESNYIFYRSEARPIDFSYCGFGHYLFDIAYTLRHLVPENRRSFLSGYQSVRELPNDYQSIVEAFFIGGTVRNYAVLASDPREYNFLSQSVPHATKRIFSKYLKGEPFLFN